MSIRPIMRVLYGPPGTGKTWLAAREAVGAVDPKAYVDWQAGKIDDEQLLAQHQKLVLEGRIKWVTFHPSYTYEDFVEGYRPRVDDGQIGFKVKDGPFREICRTAGGSAWTFVKGESVGRYTVANVEPGGVWLEAPNDRVDAVTPTQLHHVSFALIRYLVSKGVAPDDLRNAGTSEGYERRTKVAQLTNFGTTFLTNSSPHAALFEAITRKEQEGAAAVPTCRVIDEINRADLSRVFGELITLLEPDKRIGAVEERRVHLPYSGEDGFGVPASLSVIGTMNTADRSISSMDFAMRRRFAFSEVLPDPSLCPVEHGGVAVRAAFQGINRRIEILRGRDYRLGHAAFMAPALEDTRSTFGWPDDADGRLRSLAYVFRARVVPLLDEYFHEDFRKIEIALGTRHKKFGAGSRPFFDTQELTATDQDLFSEVFETDGAMPGQPATWWDPESGGGFDAVAFADAVSSMA